MSRLEPVSLLAPSFLAPYLINGDASGLSDEERRTCDAWLAAEQMGSPVSCEDAGFHRWHEAFHYFTFAADCQTYTFLRVVD